MTLSEMKGWHVRIPVPVNAGGIHHDPSRPRLTPEWLHQTFELPSSVRLIAAETAPDQAEWFCAIAQQWHLDSCMETSYDTIPGWMRQDIDRAEYYEAYQRVASGLLRPSISLFDDGRPYCALNARRADRGRPGDEEATLWAIVSAVGRRYRDWAVISDDAETAAALRRDLSRAHFRVAEPGDENSSSKHDRLIRDFATLVGARAVVCSVRGGWSSFPYAATRISGAPLIFTEVLEQSIVWRVLRAHSAVPIHSVHLGPDGVEAFAVRTLGSGSGDED